MALSRRQMLVGGAAGGGLLLAWGLMPRHYPLPLPPAPGEVAFDAWLRIGADGMVTVAIPQLEMGQGVLTVLAQVVAMELGADWRQVAVQMAPVSEIWANVPLARRWAPMWMPFWPALADGEEGLLARRWAERHRFMATADGQSLAAYEAPARHAAACARGMLAQAAARRWGGDAGQCRVENGLVRHGAQSLPFGALAAEAARLTPPDPPPLRAQPPAQDPALRDAGGFPRLDLPAKVDGAWPFAADIRLPGMVFAAIRNAPRGQAASLAAHGDDRARVVAGFRQCVAGPDWLAAVADNSWAAERALAAIAPRFAVHHPADGNAIEAALNAGLARAMAGKGHTVAQAGDAAGLLGATPQIAARYDIAPALHAPLETASVTVRLRDGRAEVWLATQAPEAARHAVAGALGMGLREVVLYPVAAGGSFDARLEHAHAVQAALIAQAVNAPVQLTWSRWQEHVASPPRAPLAAHVAARTDATGAIAAWRLCAAGPATNREFARRLFDGAAPADAAQAQDGREVLPLEGAVPPYAIANLAIEHEPVAITLPTGRMRGGGHALSAFVTESFLDEIAASLGREPLSFRMAMLGGDARLAACLQRVSALAGWNGGRDGSGAGLACHRMGSVEGGGCIAAIATARRSEQGLRVDRIVAVADIGRIVNADIARQQIEGGLIYGIGLALGASSSWAQGLPTAARLADLALPILANCPEVEVEMIASSADPFDPGELGVAVAAPAIANALFSATGARVRRLPLTWED